MSSIPIIKYGFGLSGYMALLAHFWVIWCYVYLQRSVCGTGGTVWFAWVIKMTGWCVSCVSRLVVGTGCLCLWGGVRVCSSVQTCKPHFHSGGIPKYVYIIFVEMMKNENMEIIFLRSARLHRFAQGH